MSRTRTAVAQFLQATLHVEPEPLHIEAAAVCVVAIAICLMVGLSTGYLAPAMVATAGALSAGFGAFHQFSTWRAAAILCAAIGMSASGFAGSLLGHSPLCVLGASALAGATCGLAGRSNPNFWWITLQWCIALFVSAAFPSDIDGALMRAGLLLSGGLLQLALILSAWKWLRPFGMPTTPTDPAPFARPREIDLRYAAVAAMMIGIATLLEQQLDFQNGYWIPMTALIILKPEFRNTAIRTTQRILGTLVGAAATTIVTVLLHPHRAILALLVVICAGFTYALQRAHYGIFTMGITSTVVCLIALAGVPETVVIWHRIASTLLGAALAVIAAAAADL